MRIMANEVEIRITANDLIGPAFSAAMGKLATLKAMADSVAGDRQMNFGIGDSLAKLEAIKQAAKGISFGDMNPSLLNASLTNLRSKIQSLGIADIADVNVQPGKIMTQMQLLHRLIQQSGISDVLDFNLSPANLASQLDKLGHMQYDIPIKFDMSKMPSLGNIGTQHVPIVFDYGRTVGPTMPVIHVPAVVDVKGLARDGQTMPILDIPARIDLKNIPTAGAVNTIGDLARAEQTLATATEGFGTASRDANQEFSPFLNSIFRLADGAGGGEKYMSMLGGSIMDMIPHAQFLWDTFANHVVPAFQATGVSAHNLAIAMGSGFVSAAILAASTVGRLNDNISRGLPMWENTSNLWFGLGGHVQLFAGALTQLGIPAILGTVSGIHLLVDGVIEFGATLIPAALGLAAFASAAIDSTNIIYNHFVNMNKVIDMTGQNVYPLTGAFSAMNKAAQPEVYTLLGEGLQIVAKNAGLLQSVALASGKVLDDLGARFTYAMTQGTGFSGFMKNSASDLAGWGNLIGNIGGILGNFFKVMPGYAEDILKVANGITSFAESITGSGIGQAILGIGLAAHGFLIYVGLIGTGAAVLIARTLPMLAGALLNVGLAFDRMGMAAAAGAMGNFAAAAEGAATLPWGWITIAAAAFGVLVYELATAKDAAQQFNSQVEGMVQRSSLKDLAGTLTSAIHETTVQMQLAEGNVAGLQTSVHNNAMATGRDIGTVTDSLNQAKTSVNEYAQGIQALQAQQQLVSGRIAELGKQYGGTTNALTLLNAAGITSAQITDTNNQHWAEALIEVKAQSDAMRALTDGTGRYAAAMNALSGPEQFLGDMLKSIQAITQAQDNLIQVVTEGQSAWDTFAIGTQTLGTDMQGTGAKVTDALGKISVSSSGAAQSISGLSNASLNANQAFYQQVTNAQKLIDALEQQEISTNNLTTATATIAGQMVPFAGNNNAARATIVALINDALGPGTVSLKDLNSWVNTNSTSLQGLNAIVDQSTIKAGQLANVLQTQLTNQFQQDLLASSGAKDAMKAFTDAIVNSGNNTNATAGARATLIKDLINTGMNATQAAQFVNGLQDKINAMHGTNVVITANTSGVQAAVAQVQAEIDAMHGTVLPIGTYNAGNAVPHASGGIVTGGIPGRDSVLSLLEPGELVVPTNMVASGAVDNLRGLLPGFAGASSYYASSSGMASAASMNSLSKGNGGWNSGGYPSGWGGGAVAVSLSVEGSRSGQSAFDRFMLEWVRNQVRLKGGGNVQQAFGKNS